MKNTRKNKAYIMVGLLLLVVLTSFTMQYDAPSKKSEFVIVLDAGHGGHDPGKNHKGYKEKDIALKIVLNIGEVLEKNPKFKVIYTRKTDVFVKLRDRAKIANKADADLFVSVHCNAHHTQASGTETFVVGVGNTQRNLDIAKAENEVIFLEEDHEEHYEGFDPSAPESIIGLTLMQEEYVDQSIKLAALIEENFVKKNKRKSRGVKQASLWVMHNTYMPSVLIETGFVTNAKEGAYLNSNKGQTEVASAITASIVTYRDNLELSVALLEIDDDIDVSEEVVYKVQFAAGKNKLALKSYNFKGLKNLSRSKQGDLYKYFTGNTSDYNLIKAVQQQAVKKGYTSCFVVAYKNGVEVSVSETL